MTIGVDRWCVGPPKVLRKEGGMLTWRGGGGHTQCDTPGAGHRIDGPGAMAGLPSSLLALLTWLRSLSGLGGTSFPEIQTAAPPPWASTAR